MCGEIPPFYTPLEVDHQARGIEEGAPEIGQTQLLLCTHTFLRVCTPFRARSAFRSGTPGTGSAALRVGARRPPLQAALA